MAKKYDKITHGILKNSGACATQRELFREHWPDGARIIKPTVRKAAMIGLGIEWFASHFLPGHLAHWFYVDLDQVRQEHQKKIEPIYAERQAKDARLDEQLDWGDITKAQYVNRAARVYGSYVKKLRPHKECLLFQKADLLVEAWRMDWSK